MPTNVARIFILKETEWVSEWMTNIAYTWLFASFRKGLRLHSYVHWDLLRFHAIAKLFLLLSFPFTFQLLLLIDFGILLADWTVLLCLFDLSNNGRKNQPRTSKWKCTYMQTTDQPTERASFHTVISFRKTTRMDNILMPKKWCWFHFGFWFWVNGFSFFPVFFILVIYLMLFGFAVEIYVYVYAYAFFSSSFRLFL